MQKISVLELLNLICATPNGEKTPAEEKEPAPSIEAKDEGAEKEKEKESEHAGAYANFLSRHDRAVERAKRMN